jgi:phosphohistidine phosphatase
MLIYVIRHAAAEDRHSGMSDRDRALTAEGVSRMKKVANALKHLGIAPGAIYTSPAVRAAETARIVAAALGLCERLKDCDSLLPGRDPVKLLEFISSRGGSEVAIVGHEPQLGEFVALCVSGRAKCAVDVKKSSVCCVEFDGKPAPGGAVILWHLVPSLVEKLMA